MQWKLAEMLPDVSLRECDVDGCARPSEARLGRVVPCRGCWDADTSRSAVRSSPGWLDSGAPDWGKGPFVRGEDRERAGRGSETGLTDAHIDVVQVDLEVDIGGNSA